MNNKYSKASMEPLSGESGNPVLSSIPRSRDVCFNGAALRRERKHKSDRLNTDAASLLQWSRSPERAETDIRSMMQAETWLLQWSRSLERAETTFLSVSVAWIRFASMEPLSGESGNQMLTPDSDVSYEASMEPLSGESGNLVSQSLSGSPSYSFNGAALRRERKRTIIAPDSGTGRWLQWSRSPERAETTHTSCASASDRAASMEPLSGESGNGWTLGTCERIKGLQWSRSPERAETSDFSRWYEAGHRLQWSRSPERAETSTSAQTGGFPPASFNGAALRRERKPWA